MGSLPNLTEQDILKMCEPFGKVRVPHAYPRSPKAALNRHARSQVVDSFCQPAKGFAFVTMVRHSPSCSLVVSPLPSDLVFLTTGFQRGGDVVGGEIGQERRESQNHSVSPLALSLPARIMQGTPSVLLQGQAGVAQCGYRGGRALYFGDQ
jgi:hypothetical protein